MVMAMTKKSGVATSTHSATTPGFKRPSKPPALHGFEQVKRYWDAKNNTYVARILPGEYYVSKYEETISTILGSCVAVCLRDPVTKIGGMNHILLPKPCDSDKSDDAHYGLYAMDLLINNIMKSGGDRNRLEAKVFGGGEVIHAITTHIGKRNIEFVLNFLKNEGIKLSAKDVGGKNARNVSFCLATGQAHVRTISPSQVNEVSVAEDRYVKRVKKKATEPSVQFFD